MNDLYFGVMELASVLTALEVRKEWIKDDLNAPKEELEHINSAIEKIKSLQTAFLNGVGE